MCICERTVAATTATPVGNDSNIELVLSDSNTELVLSDSNIELELS